MARSPRNIKKMRVYQASAGSSSYPYSTTIDPFGPGMAEDIFGTYGSDFEECYDIESDDGYYPSHDKVDEEDMYDGVLQSFHFRIQGSLELETNEQIENRLRSAIRRFEGAYRCMSLYALKWHYLMEELEDDEQLKKMFNDMQMIRKLKGSDTV